MRHKILFKGEIEIEAKTEDEAALIFSHDLTYQELINAIERIDYDRQTANRPR